MTRGKISNLNFVHITRQEKHDETKFPGFLDVTKTAKTVAPHIAHLLYSVFSLLTISLQLVAPSDKILPSLLVLASF